MITAGSGFLFGDHCVCQIVEILLSNAFVIFPSEFSLSAVTVKSFESIAPSVKSSFTTLEVNTMLSITAFTAFVLEPILSVGNDNDAREILDAFKSPSYV